MEGWKCCIAEKDNMMYENIIIFYLFLLLSKMYGRVKKRGSKTAEQRKQQPRYEYTVKPYLLSIFLVEIYLVI